MNVTIYMSSYMTFLPLPHRARWPNVSTWSWCPRWRRLASFLSFTFSKVLYSESTSKTRSTLQTYCYLMFLEVPCIRISPWKLYRGVSCGMFYQIIFVREQRPRFPPFCIFFGSEKLLGIRFFLILFPRTSHRPEVASIQPLHNSEEEQSGRKLFMKETCTISCCLIWLI